MSVKKRWEPKTDILFVDDDDDDDDADAILDLADSVVEEVAGGSLLSALIFFCSDAAFTGFGDLLTVFFFPKDPPKRSDSMSSRPWKTHSYNVNFSF